MDTPLTVHTSAKARLSWVTDVRGPML